MATTDEELSPEARAVLRTLEADRLARRVADDPNRKSLELQEQQLRLLKSIAANVQLLTVIVVVLLILAIIGEVMAFLGGTALGR